MKKHTFALLGGLLTAMSLTAQQLPTSSGLTDPGNQLYWARSGNSPILGQNNIFGTQWNSPIYTMTFFNYRSKLNGGVAYNINGYNQQCNGYMLLGQDLPLQQLGVSSSIYKDKGAFSLLHLNGAGTQVQELGFRSWMQTGITFTGNNDLSYFGLRQVGVTDRTETVIAWSDNQSGIADEMVFRFTGQNTGTTTLTTDLSSPDDLDGLHIARFTPTGRFGLGNTFGHIDDPQSPGYNTPRSLLHMSSQFRAGDFEPFGFMQITYRRPNGGPEIIGQGEQATDGLRLGIDNQAFFTGGLPYLNSYLRWQETSSFIIQTEDGDDIDVENSERIRITSIGALVNNYGASYLGNTGANNRTRIGITSNGSLPVTKPMSLLHLGYDTPVGSGWRNWMDIGTFTTNGNDHMYVGLKRESDASNDRFDAIFNWGDNYSGADAGPDNLRFVFTSNNTGSGDAVTNNGLEGVRMTPTAATGVWTGIGGTPGTNPYSPTGSSTNPTATLEVNAWGTNTTAPGGNSGLRFTNLNTTSLPLPNPGLGYLSVNPTGDVVYVAPPTGIGAPCGSAANIGALTANTRINLNNNNLYFSNLTTTPLPNPASNRVAIGYNCVTSLQAKFNVYQKESTVIGFNSIGSHTTTEDVGSSQGLRFIGYRGLAQGVQTQTRISNFGGYFTGTNAEVNYGVRGEAYKGPTYSAGPSLSFGGYFTAQNSETTYGVYTNGISTATTGTVYGIYATASGGATTRAGYFDGLIQVQTTVYSSDSIFKTNVNKMTGSLNMIQKLRPVSYDMNQASYPQMHFDDHLQFGYIAQEVAQIFPNLVYDSYHPSELDSLGNPIDSAVTFKGLNYNGFIALNTQAIIELNQKVDKITLSDAAIKTNVQDLDSSLAKVLEMRGVSYDWNHSIHPELGLDSVNHIGFIAQEIQQIDPRLTFVADDSLLHVEYDRIVPVLAEAIQELNDEVEDKDSIINVLTNQNAVQQTAIDDLNARLTSLENCLSALLPTLCSMNQSLIQNNSIEQQALVRKNLAVTISDRTAIILDQNVPNPFAEQTVINFSIPATVQKAQIHFYDGNGKIIQSVDVVERGLGSLTVFGSDLSSGIYTYTLVADGQIVATKKMMKQ